MDNLPREKITLANDLFFNEVKTYLNKGQLVTIPISGGSMEPFLSHGDSVLLKPVTIDDMKVGRVVLGLTNKGYMLHRIIKIARDEAWLAGDANLQQIEHIAKSDILAVVVEANRKNSTKDLHSFGQLVAARLWFLARPLRRIWNKIVNLIQ